jgi:hypothetical protein
LVADVDLCRWFDRLASDVSSAPPRRRPVQASVRSSRAGASDVVQSAVFGALVLVGACSTVASEALHTPLLAVLAMIAFLLAPLSVLVVQCGGRPSNQPRRRTRPAHPRADWSGGGMWLLP